MHLAALLSPSHIKEPAITKLVNSPLPQSSPPSLSDPLRCRLALLGCRLDLARLPEMEWGGREERIERLRAATGMMGVW